MEDFVNKVVASNIEQAITIAFNDYDKYKFTLNSELVDVNKRFRIIKYNTENYVIKRTTLKNGILELKNALILNKLLKNIMISNYNLEVVLPILKIIDNTAYIVTKYQGTTLQECLYNKNLNNPLSIVDLFAIISKFMDLGIFYRGFIPRNLIIANNNIYLIDFEDVSISNSEKGINLLLITNFLLNWGYFYSLKELKTKIFEFKLSKIYEPPLIKYEEKVKLLFGKNINNIDLRKRIMKIVLKAEKNIDVYDNDFYIMPNDLAHLISDLFNLDIDVLFDFSSAILRNKNEKFYIYFVKKISSLIITLFNKNVNLQPYIIIYILIIIEESVKVVDYKTNNISIEDFSVDNLRRIYLLVSNYLEGNFISFEKEFKTIMNKLINIVTNNNCKINIDDLTKYIYSFRDSININKIKKMEGEVYKL